MKKIVCLTLALLLCLSAVALAEEVVPSKNTSDMVVVEVDPALNTNVPADSGFVVIPVLEEDEAQAAEAVAQAMLELDGL